MLEITNKTEELMRF